MLTREPRRASRGSARSDSCLRLPTSPGADWLPAVQPRRVMFQPAVGGGAALVSVADDTARRSPWRAPDARAWLPLGPCSKIEDIRCPGLDSGTGRFENPSPRPSLPQRRDDVQHRSPTCWGRPWLRLIQRTGSAVGLSAPHSQTPCCAPWSLDGGRSSVRRGHAESPGDGVRLVGLGCGQYIGGNRGLSLLGRIARTVVDAVSRRSAANHGSIWWWKGRAGVTTEQSLEA